MCRWFRLGPGWCRFACAAGTMPGMFILVVVVGSGGAGFLGGAFVVGVHGFAELPGDGGAGGAGVFGDAAGGVCGGVVWCSGFAVAFPAFATTCSGLFSGAVAGLLATAEVASAVHHVLEHLEHGAHAFLATLGAALLFLFGGLEDFFDDFGFCGDGGASGVVVLQHVGGVCHDDFYFPQEFDDFRVGLFVDEVLDVGGEFVLLGGEFLCSLGVFFEGLGGLFRGGGGGGFTGGCGPCHMGGEEGAEEGAGKGEVDGVHGC